MEPYILHCDWLSREQRGNATGVMSQGSSGHFYCHDTVEIESTEYSVIDGVNRIDNRQSR